MSTRPPIERTIAQLEGWIESNHRERDRLSVAMQDPTSTDIQRAFAVSRLLYLDNELKQTRLLLRRTKAMRFTPQLMFTTRPMLKMPRRRAQKRKST